MRTDCTPEAEQDLGCEAVVPLAGGEQGAQRPAERVTDHVDLGRQTTSGTPQSLCLGPVGLYLDPPDRAVVLCVDEKSQIQALDRTQPLLHVHFTPTSASWINQVERFFGLLTDKAIRRGVHRSTAELEAAIATYLETTNADPKPFRWTKSADDICSVCGPWVPALRSADAALRPG